MVYVPAFAVEDYQNAYRWNNFTIVHISEGCDVAVSLPTNMDISTFSQMYLEMKNVETDQKMHFVMTDKRTYTFKGISPNSMWNVILRNQDGDIFGRMNRETTSLRERD